MATTLQLPFFSGASSIERVYGPLTLSGIRIVELVKKPLAYWIRKRGGKTRFLSIMLLAPRGTMKINICVINQCKNLLTQWDTEKENRKIYKV